MASIAKLAIQIITDTTRMVAGFRSAEGELRRFDRSAKQASGSVGGLFSRGAAFGGGFGVALKGIQLLEQGFKFSLREAEKLEERMVAVGQISKDETFAAAWERFGQTVGATARPAVQGLAKDLNDVSNILGFISGATLELRALEAAEKEAKELKEAMEDDAEAAAWAARETKKLKDEGAKLAESLRTPGEAMAAEVEGLQRLLEVGAINSETLNRAAAEIAKRYGDAAENARQLAEQEAKASAEFVKNKAKELLAQQRLQKPNVGAVEKGSTAEFSSRQDALFAIKQNAAAQKALADAQKLQAAELRRIAGIQQDQLRVQEQIVRAVQGGPAIQKAGF